MSIDEHALYMYTDVHGHTFLYISYKWTHSPVTIHMPNIVNTLTYLFDLGMERTLESESRDPRLFLVLTLDGYVIWGLSSPNDKMSKCGGKKDRMNDLKSLQL